MEEYNLFSFFSIDGSLIIQVFSDPFALPELFHGRNNIFVNGNQYLVHRAVCIHAVQAPGPGEQIHLGFTVSFTKMPEHSQVPDFTFQIRLV